MVLIKDASETKLSLGKILSVKIFGVCSAPSPLFTWPCCTCRDHPPAHSAGITIQCCARVRMGIYVIMWMGGGVRYCVASACKVEESALAILIPIPSLFCVAFACKVRETVFPITILLIFLGETYES